MNEDDRTEPAISSAANTATEQFSRFKARLLTPAIGAELIGANLANFNAELIGEVRAALLRYKVVFFRDQVLTQAQHMAFARQFGELEIHPATPEDQPNKEVLHIKHGPKDKGKEDFWHSDVTWRDCPSLGSVFAGVCIAANRR